MIGKLKGKIDEISEDHFIIDVNGVGYLVYCSTRTLANSYIGDPIEILIETHVREDHIKLYGFIDIEEKSTFTILQSVKGVGTRMALAILSALKPSEIQMALISEDKNVFTQISGVGKKLAERIITELKDKFISTDIAYASNLTIEKSGSSPLSSMSNDAISALVGLGVGRPDAQNRVGSLLNKNPDLSINDLIKEALKNTN